MENKLITTNTLWDKIKRFFKGIFRKNKVGLQETDTLPSVQNLQNTNANFNNNLKNQFEKEKENQELAEKLLYGEIGASELNDIEVDEMTQYFINDIKNIDAELYKIKQHILYMKQKIEQNKENQSL